MRKSILKSFMILALDAVYQKSVEKISRLFVGCRIISVNAVRLLHIK